MGRYFWSTKEGIICLQLRGRWIEFTTWTGLVVLQKIIARLQLASNGCLIRYAMSWLYKGIMDFCGFQIP